MDRGGYRLSRSNANRAFASGQLKRVGVNALHPVPSGPADLPGYFPRCATHAMYSARGMNFSEAELMQ